jgi:N-acetylglucosamine kinase-like BadF-type ATPase
MILIADSGSTKTHWCVCENGMILKHIFTKGINPFYQSVEDIKLEIESKLLHELKEFQINHIFFYGAGCSFADKSAMVAKALGVFFKAITIEIYSDLLGAARALFANNNGIACILGTGSNSCYYDGNEIIENVSPLGFILGDEGSGAVLGKILIADCLKNQLPKQLIDKLLQQFDFTPATILEKVYKQPFPNRFLAKFSPFLLENIGELTIFNIVYDSFDAFFVRNVMQYTLENKEVGFVGSIAYYFKDCLEIVAFERGIKISKIEQSPINGLVEYHNRHKYNMLDIG